MKRFLVEYHYQTDRLFGDDFEDHYNSCIIEAASKEIAIQEVERIACVRDIDITHVSAFENETTPFLVDLCENNNTVASFTVEAHMPEKGVKSLSAFGKSVEEARKKAEEIIQAEYPMFFQELCRVRNKKDDFGGFVEEGMVIVRPVSVVTPSMNTYLVKVDFCQDGRLSYYIKSENAHNAEEACRLAVEYVQRFYSCKAIATKIKRVAEPFGRNWG